jgi:hypothetical protein
MIICLGCSLRSSMGQNGKDWEKQGGSVHVGQVLVVES